MRTIEDEEDDDLRSSVVLFFFIIFTLALALSHLHHLHSLNPTSYHAESEPDK